MSDIIRLELTGKRADAWNRVFDTLTSVVEKAIDGIASNATENTRDKVNQLARDITDISKDFLKAKLERPALENELTIAEIALKFEELKLFRANREQIEVDTDLRKVALEKARLDLWEQRLKLAFKWFGFLQHHIIRSENGDVTLLLTKQELSSLLSEARAIQQEAADEPHIS